MRFITKAFIISVALFSATTFAADTTSETFAKTISNATSWKQLLASFKPDLNPLVAKELSALTRDLPFPTLRVRKSKLMISNENGEHMTLMFFKKNGAVTLNGKEWSIRPLATSAAEVNRILELLDGGNKVTFMDFVLPSAHAAGLGMSVAAAAYASSMAWKGKACKQEDISNELVASCSVMAVSTLVPLDPNGQINQDTHYPINLKCPDENGGTLELITRKKNGITAKIEVKYDSSEAKIVAISFSDMQSPFKELIRIAPNQEGEFKFKSLVQKSRWQSDSILSGVCLGTKDQRKRYKDMLASNSAQFQTSSNSDDFKNERKSSSGL